MKITFIILGYLCLLFQSWAFAETQSEKYQSFDVTSKERQAFVDGQNRSVNRRLQNSSNFEVVNKKISTRFDKERVLQTEQRDALEYRLVDFGLGKPQALLLIEKGVSKEIFSTYNIRKDNALSAHSFILSPEGDKVAIVLAIDGSLDDFVFVVVDLKTLKNLTGTYEKFWGDSDFIYWDNDNDILVNQKNAEGKEDVVSYSYSGSRVKKKIKFKNQTISQVMNNSWMILADEEEKNIFYNRESSFHYTIPKDYSVVAEADGLFYLSYVTTLPEREFTTYYTLNKGDNKLIELVKIEGNVTTQFFFEEFLVVVTVNGPQFYLSAVKLENAEIKKIALPNFLAVGDVTQNQEFKASKKFQVSVVSDLKDHVLEWDYAKNRFINVSSIVELKKQVLANGSISLNVDYKYVKSFDGTMIPIRLVYKTGTPLRDRQIYMESYGGFLVDGYLAPMQDQMRLEFVKRGGVYVGTGLRGGNEYGQKWHDQAVKANKMKVVEDLASVARWIVDSNLASKENIVSAGSSNGGFVVALSALLYPESFGLVIVHNGLLDLLVKEQLDKRNDGGWVDEFGDSTKASDRAFVERMSPLENIHKIANGPHFFLINGKSDTRVNPAHSIKFAKAALEVGKTQSVDLELFSTPHSGHYNLDPDYNDVFGANALSAKWTTIFDYFGMECLL